VREAEAVVDNATADAGRRRDLFRDAVISRAELDNAEQGFKVARAKLDSVRERLSPPRRRLAGRRSRERRRGDRAGARGAGRGACDAAEDLRARARSTGSSCAGTAAPARRSRPSSSRRLVTIADRSRTRVRVDVDEVDVARLREGAAGLRDRLTRSARGGSAGGSCGWGQVLGRKNVRTDEPTERVDTKVLETLIELSDGRDLPLGLRVQAFILEAR